MLGVVLINAKTHMVVRDKLYEHLVSHEVILNVLCIKRFFIRDMTYNHVLDKDMSVSFRNLMYMI